MRPPKEKRNQIVSDAMAINELVSRWIPKSRRRVRKGKVVRPHRVPQLPVPKDSDDLCKRLVCIAGFADNPEHQLLIYLAVRTLQRLDLAAKEAGLLP